MQDLGQAKKCMPIYQVNKLLFTFFQAEEVDLNAHLHGNWTVVNSKSRLHQYLQQNRCPAEFQYSTGGPDHNRFVRSTVLKMC